MKLVRAAAVNRGIRSTDHAGRRKLESGSVAAVTMRILGSFTVTVLPVFFVPDELGGTRRKER